MQNPKTEKVLEASSAPPRFIHHGSITKLWISTSIFKQKESLAGRGEMTLKIHRFGAKSQGYIHSEIHKVIRLFQQFPLMIAESNCKI